MGVMNKFFYVSQLKGIMPRDSIIKESGSHHYHIGGLGGLQYG